ncbi:MAG: hypothetical protein ABSC51_05810 [Gaiellaceae bacterium]|jgi:hypothetical protein
MIYEEEVVRALRAIFDATRAIQDVVEKVTEALEKEIPELRRGRMRVVECPEPTKPTQVDFTDDELVEVLRAAIEKWQEELRRSWPEGYPPVVGSSQVASEVYGPERSRRDVSVIASRLRKLAQAGRVLQFHHKWGRSYACDWSLPGLGIEQHDKFMRQHVLVS